VLQEVGFTISSKLRRNLDMVVFGKNGMGFDIDEKKYAEAFPKGSKSKQNKPQYGSGKKEVFFGNNGGIAGCVIIEMKHYAANQSRVCKPGSHLIPDLDVDYGNRIKGVPLMQVGMYSAMTLVSSMPPNVPLSKIGFYRLPKSYYKRQLSLSIPFAQPMIKWSARLPWILPPAISGAGIGAAAIPPPPAGNFSFTEGTVTYTVDGYIEFFIGLRY